MRFRTPVAFAAVFSLGAGFAVPAPAAESITLTNFGGAFEAAMTKAWVEPFTAETGIRVTKEQYGGGLAKLRSMVAAKNTIWDVMDLETNDAITGCDEGLFQKLPPSLLKDQGDFIPGAVLPCSIAMMVWSTVFAYDTTKLAKAPTKVADFFDLAAYPGKRGLRRSPKVLLEWALMADGVLAANVYKTLGTADGLDRAFKKLDTIKSSIVWWETGAQAPQLLADGAVAMTMAFNGRIYDAQTKDAKPFKIVWDGQIYDFEWWAVTTGTKQKDAAERYVAFATDPGRIGDLSRYIAYAPTRKSAIAKIDPAILQNLPTAPDNFRNPLQIDANFWADNLDSINKRFQAWAGS